MPAADSLADKLEVDQVERTNVMATKLIDPETIVAEPCAFDVALTAIRVNGEVVAYSPTEATTQLVMRAFRTLAHTQSHP